MQPHIISPFKGACLQEDVAEFNKRMSAVRVCVEWSFGHVLQNWAFVDYSKNQKLYLQQASYFGVDP
ncbi:hypothetical protein DFJ73DRAFT_664315, partial [Zopfochytrium polystomum]